MEKYLVPVEQLPEISKPLPRQRWTRNEIEVKGRFPRSYRHDLSTLLMQSYSAVSVFPHRYHVDGAPCETHGIVLRNSAFGEHAVRSTRQGVSYLEFDSKGIYLVSVTKSGCLTVHDFESLYCDANDLLLCLDEHESKLVLHLSLGQQLDIVRWNPSNQDEVACTSWKKDDVPIFDISYVSSEPVEVLKTKRIVTVHGSEVHKGLSDIAFSTTDKSRLFASDTNGVVNMWDRRTGSLPCLELTADIHNTINSIQLNMENQVVFGAGRHGIIHMWDLRGGRVSSAFQSHKEMSHPPVTCWKLASMLEKIGTLKAQSAISPKEVHSINFDPSCPYQLAFHLDDGWSGVVNMYNFEVTHVHCPPPAWLNDSNISADLLYLRKPTWLPTYSVYVVGSAYANGIHLLDFYPDSSSPCHVDYSEDAKRNNGEGNGKAGIKSKENKFVGMAQTVTACAAHPLNGTIIAGTKDSSLVVVSQQKLSI